MNTFDPQHPLDRASLIAVLKAGLRVKDYRFTRQAALAWLATFPGDLLVNCLLAQAMLEEGRVAQVIPILETLCTRDPEFIQAQKLLSTPRLGLDKQKRALALANVAALGGHTPADIQIPLWAVHLRQARQSQREGNLAEAEKVASQAIIADSSVPLPALFHISLVRQSGDMLAVSNLANVYHSRWPDSLAFSLYLSEARLHVGDEAGSVSLMHQCVAYDAAGQVSERIWGAENPYQALWPENMHIYFDVAVPANVSRELGWNQLGGGPGGFSAPEAVTYETSVPSVSVADHFASPKAPNIVSHRDMLPPDTLRSIQEEFERLAERLRKPGAGRADSRFPVYVICSTREGLGNQYGSQTASSLLQEFQKLASAIRKKPNWGAMVFIPDDEQSIAPYGITQAPYNDPWKIKLSLTELDKTLARKGEMIGAVLLIGNGEVIPFHKLPNPTDDFDTEVLSDNPYATRDENYFVPEWPVGRLPGGAGPDVGLLLEYLRKLTAFYDQVVPETPWWKRFIIFSQVTKAVKTLFKYSKAALTHRPSFGYTAAVWKQSSMAVFKPIGEGQSMLVSPPSRSGNGSGSVLKPATLSYFNLHGLPDSSEWYGQREMSDNSGTPDYPVALSPKDVLNHGQAPKIVFSEACYGAHIVGKNENDALSLKFLASGTSAVVGSTCISYGSVTTPLIAADLVGNLFWKHLREGMPAGEALQHAKIRLVQEMNQRQGYLDGEDQKTLISFVLYGDPLARLDESKLKSLPLQRPRNQPAVKTICDRQDGNTEIEPVTLETMGKVKKIVDRYLPGLQDADFHITRPHSYCSGSEHSCPTSHFITRSKQQYKDPHHTVVTLSKSVPVATHTHRHYARVTLDSQGKMIKLSISR